MAICDPLICSLFNHHPNCQMLQNMRFWKDDTVFQVSEQGSGKIWVQRIQLKDIQSWCPGESFPHQKIFAPPQTISPNIFKPQDFPSSQFLLIQLSINPTSKLKYAAQAQNSGTCNLYEVDIYIYIYIWLEILLNKTRIKYSEQLFLKMKIFICICNVF